MHLKIGQRILAAFTLIVGLTIGLGVYQTSNIANMRDLSESIVGTDFKALSQLRRIAESQREVQLPKERPVVLYFHGKADRSEEHTSELQPLMRISYAGFCLHKIDSPANHIRETRAVNLVG